MGFLVILIQTEGQTYGWGHNISGPDIGRIVARYKEYVSYWNISLDIIQSELKAFADALGPPHNYFEVATLFDVSDPHSWREP